MKIDSEECIQLLKGYSVKTDMEKLAIKVLLVPEDRLHEVCDLPGIPDMNGDELDKLAKIIGDIRDDIGIEEEA